MFQAKWLEWTMEFDLELEWELACAVIFCLPTGNLWLRTKLHASEMPIAKVMLRRLYLYLALSNSLSQPLPHTRSSNKCSSNCCGCRCCDSVYVYLYVCASAHVKELTQKNAQELKAEAEAKPTTKTAPTTATRNLSKRSSSLLWKLCNVWAAATRRCALLLFLVCVTVNMFSLCYVCASAFSVYRVFELLFCCCCFFCILLLLAVVVAHTLVHSHWPHTYMYVDRHTYVCHKFVK